MSSCKSNLTERQIQNQKLLAGMAEREGERERERVCVRVYMYVLLRFWISVIFDSFIYISGIVIFGTKFAVTMKSIHNSGTCSDCSVAHDLIVASDSCLFASYECNKRQKLSMAFP